MPNFALQLAPLLGVVVGAVLSYVVTARVERAKWNRERAARWDSARMEAYAAYANIIKQYTQVATRIAASVGLGSSEKPLSPDEGLSKLAELEVQRGTRWEAVLLLGDADTIAAARGWHECVWKLEWFATGRLRSEVTWKEMWEEATRDRARFYECARRSLEIPRVGELPESGWHRKPVLLAELSKRESGPPAL